MKWVQKTAFALTMSVSACAATSHDPGVSLAAPAMPLPAPAADPLRPAFSAVPSAGLPPQALDDGECGLFLWSQTDVSRFIFFAKAGTGQAAMLIGEEPVSLSLTASRGTIFGQFLTELDYIDPNSGQKIEATFTPGETLVDGARISGGRIRISGVDGWQTVLPVLGVRACKPTTPDDRRLPNLATPATSSN